MRHRFCLLASSIALLIAALPVHAQEIPDADLPVDAPVAVPVAPDVPAVDLAGPAAPDWVGTYQGIAYYVVDDTVRRHDGASVPAEATHAVFLAQRATDLLAADPAFAERLSQPDAEAELGQALAQTEAVTGHLRSAADLLATQQVAGLLSGILPSLPLDPASLLAQADAVAADVAAAQGDLDRLAQARQTVAAAVEQYDATHAVEDKLALYQAYADALPAYETAAASVGQARTTAEAAAARAAVAARELESKATGLLGLRLPVEGPAELAAATDGLMDAAGPLHAAVNHLQEDATFMATSLAEPEPPALPGAWVVGGGLGAVGAGAGGLYWLRRRLGLP